MDTAPLKSFATSARTELIREVGARITAVLAQSSPERVEQPRAVDALERAITAGGGGDKGKAHVADKVAYTWFNRIIALRFLDANGYTGIGVVSPATDQVGQPEMLAAAKRGQIDGDAVRGASAATIAGLLNGTRQPRPGVNPQAEAYALLLADYCRYWNKAMPFMFEREGDYTELLIPANLLAEDSVLNRSVKVLSEEVCQDVEVIGWLYQFYISDKKAEVFAGFKANKKAGADEIPAATQIFTPHWIVRYLVENSVGRLWMLNHPESRLVDQMDYYIAPVDDETDFLRITKPQELRVIDPACGSGHMLTYAFDLLYAIYEEEGYTPSQIPGLILSNNLYGTEIDPRAGALAAFALSMKSAARRKLFLKNPVEPNICVLEPISFSADELSYLVTKDGDRDAEEAFWNQFAEAGTFGALIQPDPAVTVRLSAHLATLEDEGDILRADALGWAQQVIRQAEFLLPRYSVAVANPPYMGSGNMDGALAVYITEKYSAARYDLFAAFTVRALEFLRQRGIASLVTMEAWMYRAFYGAFRRDIVLRNDLQSLIHMPYIGQGRTSMGINFGTAAFSLQKSRASDRHTHFLCVRHFELDNAGAPVAFPPSNELSAQVDAREFLTIPGAPIVYAASAGERAALSARPRVSDDIETREGLTSGDNNRFLRRWFEVSNSTIAGPATSFPPGADFTRHHWFMYVKGGDFRRWYGNFEFVVDWEDDGARVRGNVDERTGRVRSHNYNGEYAFREGLGWSGISSSRFSARYVPPGHMFDTNGPMGFAGEHETLMAVLAVLNGASTDRFLSMLAPALDFKIGQVMSLPVPASASVRRQLAELAEQAVELSRHDWDRSERSRDHAGWLVANATLVADAVEMRRGVSLESTQQLATIRERVDELIAVAFGFDAAVVVGREDLSLTVPTVRDEVADLISYAVGCMFGRYSLDEPGLILADQGATLQDYLAKTPSPTFTPDADNVIPILDGDWFEDDIAERFRQFLRVAFGERHFEENLQFIVESLGTKSLRDYFVKSFYRDHTQRYRKRPIYWLFSSPKGSFNALIYMHRYTPSTVSTVMTYLREYVTKLESALQQAERAGNAKEADRLRKVLVELNQYEHDTLFPKASENVDIDLDDGVKANYPKFGAALKRIPGLEAASD